MQQGIENEDFKFIDFIIDLNVFLQDPFFLNSTLMLKK